VISGDFHVGMGDKLDMQKGLALSAGGFGAVPAAPKITSKCDRISAGGKSGMVGSILLIVVAVGQGGCLFLLGKVFRSMPAYRRARRRCFQNFRSPHRVGPVAAGEHPSAVAKHDKPARIRRESSAATNRNI
jgi:hypothetical protein